MTAAVSKTERSILHNEGTRDIRQGRQQSPRDRRESRQLNHVDRKESRHQGPGDWSRAEVRTLGTLGRAGNWAQRQDGEKSQGLVDRRGRTRKGM